MAKEMLTGDGEVLAYFESKQPKPNDLKIFPAEGSAHYTVGWICAITTEYVAAQAFLDEKHDRPEYVHPHDYNDYTLGKIGRHNVVIAVLPDGEYGISSATRVATDMLHSFPNIRIGLMVGIGGGAPTLKHDIRLGDIVVSAPRDGKGGVFQYDFGKTTQDKSFRTTGFLDQPPAILRAAVNGLKAQYECDGHQLGEAINSILQVKPRLRKKYRRPSPESDRLYNSTVKHPLDNEQNCTVTCGNDISNLRQRDERVEDQDNPAIHYGIIASANQLMKDALIRDKLAEENGVMCFEMEAAGLMNHFPCLVIRGICDYSDTHKNKEWRGYAAMTAAAYAKDILYRIAPNKVDAEKSIANVLKSVQEDTKEIHRNLQNTTSAIEDLSSKARRKDIERWLLPPDPSTNYNKALQQRQEGTGLWFLQSHVYTQWKKLQNSTLWLYGIPGCGKTILSSTIIEDLEKTFTPATLLYFYFDFSDDRKQTLDSMVRSLVSQLYCKSYNAREKLDSLFSSCEDGNRQPTHESLRQVLLLMVDSTEGAYIVLDALDECQTRTGSRNEGLLSWIRELLDSGQKNVHLVATSRPEQDIQSTLSEFVDKEHEINIQSDLTRDDINAYIRTRVREGEGLKRWRKHPDVQEEIEAALIQKANGMFRWAACQIDALESCLDYITLESALTSLPKTLDETYHRILRDIPSEHKRYTTILLQLITFSERPITIQEAVDAIAVRTDKQPYFSPKNRMPDPEEISRYCSSLVIVISVEKSSQKESENLVELQLAHFSVKEYLLSKRLEDDIARDFQEYCAGAAIAKVCLAYLLQFEENLLPRDIIQEFPFAKYSAQYWMTNAAKAKDTDNLTLQLIEQFFCSKIAYKVGYGIYQPDQTASWSIVNPPAPALYYAAFGGLLYTVKGLLNRGADINVQGGFYGNVLYAAVSQGHEQIVELLVEKGADVNAQGGKDGNALYAASSKGHEQIVKLLVEKGADVNVQGGFYGNALYAAVSQGHEQILRLLVDKGADVNMQGGKYDNALYAAIHRGHEQIVRLLVEKGADVNAQVGRYGSALQAAIYRGHRQIVELLIEKGADVNAEDGFYGNVLQAATSRGHKQIVSLIIGKGAGVNVQGGFYGNALYAASSEGYEQIVRLLVEKGADINSQGGFHGNALQVASYEGHEQIVSLLVENGANVNAQAGKYGNALQAAVSRGHKQIVKLLVEQGADVNAQVGEDGNALYAASSEGHEQIVRLLIENGADVNVQGGGYGNALQAAIYRGHKEIARLLVENDADVNVQGGIYGNALYVASSEGSEQIVRLLVEKGADTNAQGGKDGSPLCAAVSRGHKHIVKLLVEKGADVNGKGGFYGNPLQAAISRGYDHIVSLLVEKGADINARGGFYGNALQAAVSRGHKHIVRLLIEKGADINARGGEDGSALYAAIYRGYEQIVGLLVEKGADVNVQCGFYGNALQAAISRGHKQIVSLLIEKGADVNAQVGEEGKSF